MWGTVIILPTNLKAKAVMSAHKYNLSEVEQIYLISFKIIRTIRSLC